MTLEEMKARQVTLRKEKDEINVTLKDLRMAQATKEAEIVELQRQITMESDAVVALEKEISELMTAERIVLMTTPQEVEG